MWFKNLRAYRLTYDTGLEAERLEELLLEHPFVPCGKSDTARMGWVPPLPDGQMLTHTVGRCTMLCLRRQEKVMPAASVRERLDERVAEWSAREGRQPGRREKTALKDEVVFDLLPRALTRSELTYAYFDFERQWLLVDTASAPRAERLIDTLRAAVEVLPVVPLDSAREVAEVMTGWLTARPPAWLVPENDIELQNMREARNVVRCRYQDIDSREVLSHIDAGKRVTALGLVWRDAVRCVLTGDFAVRRLRFEDAVAAHEGGTDDDPVTQFDQDFAVMIVQLGRLLDELLEACGGMEKI